MFKYTSTAFSSSQSLIVLLRYVPEHWIKLDLTFLFNSVNVFIEGILNNYLYPSINQKILSTAQICFFRNKMF